MADNERIPATKSYDELIEEVKGKKPFPPEEIIKQGPPKSLWSSNRDEEGEG